MNNTWTSDVAKNVQVASESLAAVSITPGDHEQLHVQVRQPSAVTNDSEINIRYKKLFALVIGINTYMNTSIKPLRGAVADAEAVREFLLKVLQVPSVNIECVLDDAATRSSIIENLLNLGINPRINPGDPILIYYAAHGGEATPPPMWGQSTIQTIIPHDFGALVDGRTVPSIPDRTIGALLGHLAELKGNNITVILDCCHSGSGTRQTNTYASLSPRCINISETLPKHIDSSILSSSLSSLRRSEIASGFLQRGLRSHVLLAACGSRESAMEDQHRGVFTVALLRTLATVCEQSDERVTYRDLLQRVYALPGQNPQCEGHFQDRALFDAEPAAPRTAHFVRRDGSMYSLAAGAVNGVSLGSTYAVYRTRDEATLWKSPLGFLHVSRVCSTQSTLVPTSTRVSPALSSGEIAYALQCSVGVDQSLLLSATAEDRASLLQELAIHVRDLDEATRPLDVRFVNRADADLAIAINSNILNIEVLYPPIKVCGLHELPFSIDMVPGNINNALSAALHFFWHLKRTSPQHPLQGQVEIEFHKLQEVPADDDFDDPSYVPHGSDLNVSGTITLLVDDDAAYGITLVNNSSLPLYASLFYFSSSDLSITSYYEPPSAGNARVDPPLQPHSTLTIGYGSAGAVPYNYYLWGSQELDVGFLKLFLSTEYVDLSHTVQGSPFHGDHRKAAMVSTSTEAPGVVWDTSLVTVVQRSRPVS